jgi:L-alanine-DL-glutamate epimerase-like enolase superfamily enzyme
MEITAVEIHEFTYELRDVNTAGGIPVHQIYEPGSTLEPTGMILTIRASDGTEGHYRSITYGELISTHVQMAARDILIGRDPLEREEIWQDLWRAYRHTDHFGLGPIDIALWDLAGKHHGESISSLLGGFRSEVPAYASTFFMDETEGGLDSPAAYAEFAETCLERGYSGYKMHGYPGGDVDTDIEICRAVGEAVGDEMDLMLDPASGYSTYREALRVGRILDEYDYFWYEDPLAETGQSINAMKTLSRELNTPLLGLEHVRSGPFGRADHIAAEAAEMVRADVHQDGGITGCMKIANVAEAFGLDVEFHLGGPATLHCLSAIRNTNYFEHSLVHPQGIEWMNQQGFADPVETLTDDGTIPVPNGPGLGVEIDWDLVEDRKTDYVEFS